jgi:hypothetical protein
MIEDDVEGLGIKASILVSTSRKLYYLKSLHIYLRRSIDFSVVPAVNCKIFELYFLSKHRSFKSKRPLNDRKSI